MRWPSDSSRAERVHELVQAEQLADEAEHPLVALARDVPHHALPVEARGQRVIPPELRALAEHDADPADVAHALAHRGPCRARAPRRVGREQAREQLDGGALARAVRARVGDDLAAPHVEVDSLQRVDPHHRRVQQVLEQRRAAAPSAARCR